MLFSVSPSGVGAPRTGVQPASTEPRLEGPCAVACTLLRRLPTLSSHRKALTSGEPGACGTVQSVGEASPAALTRPRQEGTGDDLSGHVPCPATSGRSHSRGLRGPGGVGPCVLHKRSCRDPAGVTGWGLE